MQSRMLLNIYNNNNNNNNNNLITYIAHFTVIENDKMRFTMYVGKLLQYLKVRKMLYTMVQKQ